MPEKSERADLFELGEAVMAALQQRDQVIDFLTVALVGLAVVVAIHSHLLNRLLREVESLT